MIVIGINHKTAPIAVREKFFLTPTERDLLLAELKTHPQVIESFVFSTCNRTEIYLHRLDQDLTTENMIRFITRIKKIPFKEEYTSYFYQYHDRDLVKHLLEVTAGLDSLVLGEKQILGQVKTAVERARNRGMLSKKFNILTQTAIRAGKKVQHETDISFGGSSVSWAAISMAEHMLGGLENKSILIVGAGKMSELALSRITQKKLSHIYLMNRTEANARELAAQHNAEPVSFCDIKEVLSEVDFCICSASAPHYIIEPNTVEKVMALRQERPLLMIDISMPRNIDPDVGRIQGVKLFTIDDMDQVVEESMNRRHAAVAQVRTIIEEKIAEFYVKWDKIRRSDPAYRFDGLESTNP